MWYECVLLHASVVSKKQAYVGIAETTTLLSKHDLFASRMCWRCCALEQNGWTNNRDAMMSMWRHYNFEIRAPGARNIAQVSALDLIYRPEK